MKLAEALIERAALQRRIEQLQARVQQSARFQEGEDPAEDAAALLREADGALDELQRLILEINLTNAAVSTADGVPLTAALAERDVLRRRHALLIAAADAASGASSFGGHRQLRSELRWLPALPVAEVRAQADDVARRLRLLEAVIQRTNWEEDVRQR